MKKELNLDSVLEIVTLLEVIGRFADIINYPERLISKYRSSSFNDDLFEIFWLGRGQDVPSSEEIENLVKDRIPEVNKNLQENYKQIRSIIVKALILLEDINSDYVLTMGESYILGSIGSWLQANNGLLFKNLEYEEEEIAEYPEMDDNFHKIKDNSMSEDEFSFFLNNDKWITVKPHGEDERGRHLMLETGETPKQAMKRQWGVDLDRKKSKETQKKKDKDIKEETKTREERKNIANKKKNEAYKEFSELKEKLNDIEKKVSERMFEFRKNDKEYNKIIRKINLLQDEDNWEKNGSEINELGVALANMEQMQAIRERYSLDWERISSEQADKFKEYVKYMEEENAIIEEEKKEEAEGRKERAKSFINPKEIAGVKNSGKMTHKEANSGNVNPNYAQGGGYRINCQSCVVAYEMRLRGYNVEVLSNTRGSMLQELSRHYKDAWIDTETGEAPKTIDIKSNNLKTFISSLNQNMKEGERYCLYLAWKTGHSAHVVNMFMKDGKPTIYDAQNSKEYSGSDLERLCSFAKMKGRSKPAIMRIDNLAFNPFFMDKIVKAK